MTYFITFISILAISNTIFIIHKSGGIYRIFSRRRIESELLDSRIQEVDSNFYSLTNQVIDLQIEVNKLVKAKNKSNKKQSSKTTKQI
jgi:hypothetical protein